MNSIVKDNIIYKGIDTYVPLDITSFVQSNVNKIITIDKSLPDVIDIIKVSTTSEIIDSYIVKTATGTSLEGQYLSGYKYLSEGKFLIRIDYSSDYNNPYIYTYKDYIYFDTCVTLDESTSSNSKIFSNIYIEDVYAKLISENSILINITFVFITEDY